MTISASDSPPSRQPIRHAALFPRRIRTTSFPVPTIPPRDPARVSVRHWIPSLKEVRTPPGPDGDETAFPAARSRLLFPASLNMARTSPPYSRSSSAIRGKQETSDIISGSPAKIPETMGPISLSRASPPRRRRAKSARLSSIPPGGPGISGVGSRASRSLPGQEIRRLAKNESAPSGSRCSSPAE